MKKKALWQPVLEAASPPDTVGLGSMHERAPSTPTSRTGRIRAEDEGRVGLSGERKGDVGVILALVILHGARIIPGWTGKHG